MGGVVVQFSDFLFHLFYQCITICDWGFLEVGMWPVINHYQWTLIRLYHLGKILLLYKDHNQTTFSQSLYHNPNRITFSILFSQLRITSRMPTHQLRITSGMPTHQLRITSRMLTYQCIVWVSIYEFCLSAAKMGRNNSLVVFQNFTLWFQNFLLFLIFFVLFFHILILFLTFYSFLKFFYYF